MACRVEGPGQGMDPKLADLYRHVGELLSRYKSGKLPKAFKIIPNLRNWQQVSSLAWQRSLHGAFADCKYRAAREWKKRAGLASRPAGIHARRRCQCIRGVSEGTDLPHKLVTQHSSVCLALSASHRLIKQHSSVCRPPLPSRSSQPCLHAHMHMAAPPPPPHIFIPQHPRASLPAPH